MNLETITAEIADRTGYRGPQLTQAVLFYAMLLADVTGNKAAADHFERRVREIEPLIANHVNSL